MGIAGIRFPKIRDLFWGARIIMIMVFGDLYWGLSLFFREATIS